MTWPSSASTTSTGPTPAKGTTTSLRSLGKDSSLHAGVGYDDVTGVGSPGAGYVSSYRP